MESGNNVEELVDGVNDKLILGNDDEEFVLDDVEGEAEEVEWRWCLIGKFITDKVVKFSAMQSALAELWKPGRGIYCRELGPNLFAFHFFHEVDFKRVVDEGPWTFDHALLVWKKLEKNDDPGQVDLVEADFWVQVHDVIPGMRSERVCKVIGNYLGKYIDSEIRSSDGDGGGDYMRVRASIDVRTRLKHTMKIKKTGGDWVWMRFQYERLPSFCFICGIIGHADKFCELLYANPSLMENKPYGPWLRAQPRRVVQVPANRWLRNSRGEHVDGSSAVAGGNWRGREGGGLTAKKSELTRVNDGTVLGRVGVNGGGTSGGAVRIGGGSNSNGRSYGKEKISEASRGSYDD